MNIELPWDGRPFTTPVLAIDTETVMVDLDREVPDLVVMSVSDGDRTVLVFPDQVCQFLSTHYNREWVFWNIGFDFWVLRKIAARETRWDLVTALDDKVDEPLVYGPIHDGMLLEQLVRLGEGRDKDTWFGGKSLAKATQEYLGAHLITDKETVRTSFTLDMAANWQTVDRSFWEYAAQDALVTARIWPLLVDRALLVNASLPSTVRPPAQVALEAGLLSETIQVKAAIALAQITRNGIKLDRQTVGERVAEYTQTCMGALETLKTILPGVCKVTKKGKELFTEKTGMPQFHMSLIRDRLTMTAAINGIEPPLTFKTHEVKLTADWWAEFRGLDPFIDAWVTFAEAVKTLQLLKSLEGRDEVHPSYRTMVTTGRTSATRPNIQQVPRDGWFRSLFVARPGHRLTAVDYSFIELRTLAQDIEYHNGRSTLADVIRSGIDPHEHTAALAMGMGLDEFRALKASDPKLYKARRQAAKAVNFGIPGGLGKAKLRIYAKQNYGVDLSVDQAQELRNTLISKVYPELTGWLDDGLATRFALSLGVAESTVRHELRLRDKEYGDPVDHPIARVIAGHRHRHDGQLFSQFYLEDIWVSLANLSERSQLPQWVEAAIRERRGSPELLSYLIVIPSVTLTGRVRADTEYGEYRNTKFQGLASDGAKLALWNLTRAGYRIVAFIHDEILIESPLTQEESSVEREVQRIMSQSFRSIHPTGVPVDTACVSGERWEKA